MVGTATVSKRNFMFQYGSPEFLTLIYDNFAGFGTSGTLCPQTENIRGKKHLCPGH